MRWSQSYGGNVQMTVSWRAVALQAQDRIVKADPEEVPYILFVSATPSTTTARSLT